MKINIGTNKGNIIGHEIEKEFKDILYKDIREIVYEKFNCTDRIIIYGWCETKLEQ